MEYKTIRYPIDTDEIIAECSSCGNKYAPTLKHVIDICVPSDMGDKTTSYAVCPKCGHRSEWFKKGISWRKYSPEEIAKKKKIVLWTAVFLIILFGYLCYALIDWSILKP
tara:strand:- start:127 stop:456 length:330 start_codon:yes stop_codon:yes gene_type:complete